MASRERPKAALLCLLPGLGDALIASPVARALHDSGYVVDALTMLRPVAEYANDLGLFRSVVNLPLLESAGGLRSLLALRNKRYDVVIVPAPAARWQYAAVALAVGGRRTFIHRYGGAFSFIARLGGMTQVPLRGGHRIAENLRLLDALEIRRASPTYEVPASWRAGKRHPGLVGFHAGSMRYKGNETKRWPLENFAAVAKEQYKRGRHVRAFFGPSELEDARCLKDMVPEIEIIERPLDEAARLLDECSAFLGNDSGLTHLAAGLDVPVITIFGMTDPTRVAPVGPSVVVRPSDCPPCFDEGLRTFSCVRNIGYKCIRDDITIQDVNSAIDAVLKAAPGNREIAEQGSFRLYGRLRSAN